MLNIIRHPYFLLAVCATAAVTFLIFSDQSGNRPNEKLPAVKQQHINQTLPATSTAFPPSATTSVDTNSFPSDVRSDIIEQPPESLSQNSSVEFHVEETVLTHKETESDNLSPKDIVPIQKQFQQEEVDSTFAIESEFVYQDLFNSHENLANFALVDVQCKTKTCKLSFAITDPQQYFDLSTQFFEALSQQSLLNQQFEAVIEEPNGDGTATLYLSQSLPRKY